MRLITAALTFLVLITIAAAVKADDTPKAPNAKADEIVAKHLEAIGGVEAHEKLKTRQIEGTLTIGDRALKMSVTQKSPDKVFGRFEVPGEGVVTEGCDGKSAWKKEGGVLRRIAGPELAQKLWDARFHKTLELVTKNKLTYRQKEMVKGKDCHVLRFTTDDKFIDVCIDAKTHLMNEYRIGAKGGKASEYMAFRFGDYREVDGIQLAFSIDLSFGPDHTFLSLKHDEVTHGGDVADALFAIPIEFDPLDPLNRRVGTWVNKMYEKKAEWTPEERTITGEETIKWILDKKLIQGEANRADGTKSRWLTNYDTEAKVYRSWYFNSQNAFPRGETVGQWDAKNERMDWKVDFGNGVLGEMRFQYPSKDKFEWSLIARDTDGKLMLDTGGTLTRKKQDAGSKDATPQRSLELQVLDRFLGTWECEGTEKRPGEEATSRNWVEIRKLTLGGKSTHMQILNGTGEEFHELRTYDPKTKTYGGVVMLGLSLRRPTNGTWDEKTQAMTFNMTLENGDKYTGVHRFIDDDHVKYTGVIVNAAGEVVKEIAGTRSRRTTAVTGSDTPKRSAEQQVLDRLVGEWKAVVTNKTDGSISTTMTSRSWSRGGKGVVIIQEGINLSDGSESALIWRYDSENKLYRLANLLPNGWFMSGGAWNEKSQTMTWHDYTNSWGGSGNGVHRFIDNDHSEWTFVVKNAEGKVVADFSGKVSRRKETPKTKGN